MAESHRRQSLRWSNVAQCRKVVGVGGVVRKGPRYPRHCGQQWQREARELGVT
jgi:hypothetical protein